MKTIVALARLVSSSPGDIVLDVAMSPVFRNELEITRLGFGLVRDRSRSTTQTGNPNASARGSL